MTDKELKKLNRAELLQMLIQQMEENEKLLQRIETLEKQQNDKTIKIREAGSIAEASLQISGVFAAAEEAAKLYLENIKAQSGNQKAVCDQMIAEARKEADAIIAEANLYRRRVVEKVQALFREQDGLKKLIQTGKE